MGSVSVVRIGHFAEAIADARVGLTLLPAHQCDQICCRLRSMLAGCLAMSGASAEARIEVHSAVAMVRSAHADAPEELALLLCGLSDVLHRLGDHEAAVALGHEALAILWPAGGTLAPAAKAIVASAARNVALACDSPVEAMAAAAKGTELFMHLTDQGNMLATSSAC